MPRLPYEIWFRIANHLSDEEIGKLLALNRVFLELALNSRYKEVSLGRWFPKENEKEVPGFFKHLSMPLIASRIQRVTLPLQPGLLEAPSSSDNIHTLVERVLDRIRPGRGRDRRLLRTSRPPPDVDPQAVKLLSTLRNVHSLNLVECIYGDCSTPPIVALAWMTLGNNLRELDVSARPQKVANLLCSAPCLPRLEALKLELKRDPFYVSSSGLAGRCDAVSGFIRSVSKTLKDLRVVEKTGRGQLGFRLVSGLVLNGVGHVPKLERFSFDVGFDRDRSGGAASGLALQRLEDFFGFINANNSNLRHLAIPPIPSRLLPNQDDVGHPWRLESFTLLPSSPPMSVQASVDATKVYLRNCAHTLTSLALLDQYLSPSELRDILCSLYPTYSSGLGVSRSQPTTTCELTNLSLQVISISPQIISLLATELPCLKGLSLTFASLSSFCTTLNPEFTLNFSSLPVRSSLLSRPITSQPDLLLFKDGMKRLVYPQWGLESVTLIGPRKNATIEEKQVLLAIGDALRKSVPGLRAVDVRSGIGPIR